MNATLVFRFVRSTASRWLGDRAPSMAAALAFYSAFSLAPLVVILTAVAGEVFGAGRANQAIVGELSALVGARGAEAVQMLLAAAHEAQVGMLASMAGAVTLVIGATSVFVELQADLDRIWRVPGGNRGGVWSFVRSRLLSIGLILGIGFLLLVSLVVSSALAAFGRYWLEPGSEALVKSANFVISFAILTLLFALIYKGLPSAPTAWNDVWIGSAGTALLFGVGHLAIATYLGTARMVSTYYAAGALMILLLWLYYSALIFLFGAEFCRLYAQCARRRGRRIRAPGPPSRLKEAPAVAGARSYRRI